MKLTKDVRANFFSLARKKLANIRILDRRYLYLLWEQMHLENVLRHLQVDCVFDVGANAGQYATMLRRRAGYKGLIISFEPIPRLAAQIRERAKGDPRWIVEEVALGAADGERSFNVMRELEFSSLNQPVPDQLPATADVNKVQEVIRVRTETLTTTYERLKRVHGFARPFLKLDTQGSDVDIVSHGRPVMQEFVGLQSELAVTKLYDTSVDFRDALTLYEQCGFALSAFVPNNAAHFPRLVETDCIMVRRDLMDART